MDHLRIMGFLLLLFTTLFALQFAEARVLDHHFHNAALSQHNSLDLDAVAEASSRDGAEGHMTNYSEPNPGISSGNSTHAANNTIITVELLLKETTPGDGSISKAPAGIKKVASIEGNADILNEMLNSDSSPGVGHMSVHDGIESNILSVSGQSPGVGHSEKSKTKSKYSPSKKSAMMMNILPSGPSPGVGNSATNGRNTMEKISIESESKKKSAMMMNILPSGPSPGVGNSATNGRNTMEEDKEGMGIQTFNKLPSGPSPGVGHSYTNAEKSELGTFNKLPSGPSPGVGHKVTNDYTEMAQESESKKSAMMMNILPSGPSPGGGNSATNGRNMIEKIRMESESKKKTGLTLESESKKKSPFMNILPSGPSPGVGNSATNGRNTMEETESASEDKKGTDYIPIFHKLPGGPSPGGGHSYVEKSASTVRNMQLSSITLMKTSSSPSPGDGNSSMNKSNPALSETKKVEKTGGTLDRKIGCDDGLDFYGTPTPPMFRITAAGS